jgi:hypothetical protein
MGSTERTFSARETDAGDNIRIQASEVTGGWRKKHNEEFHDLYFMSDMINVNKPRTNVWAGHTARIGNNRKYIQF